MNSPAESHRFVRQVVHLLQKERKRQGLSANQLAKKIGMSRTTITHMESHIASPQLWVVFDIAHGLGMSLTPFIREAEMGADKGAASV